MPNVIDNFQKTPLSNFYTSPFDDTSGTIWPTVEHYFQAMKAVSLEEVEMVLCAQTPGDAKKLGRKVTLRPDWEAVKYDVMLFGLRMKFAANAELKKYLLGTGDALLVEGNSWHDQVWGVCSCGLHSDPGRNWLGVLLMSVRAELRAGVT